MRQTQKLAYKMTTIIQVSRRRKINTSRYSNKKQVFGQRVWIRMGIENLKNIIQNMGQKMKAIGQIQSKNYIQVIDILSCLSYLRSIIKYPCIGDMCIIGQLLVLYYKGHNYKQKRMSYRNFNLLGHVLKNQKTSIFICQKRNQKLRDYTFLQSKTEELVINIRSQAHTFNLLNKTNQVIHSYLQQLQKSKQIINKVTQSQITHDIVGNSDLNQIVGNFVHLKKCLDQEICESLDKNGQNYSDLAFLCCGFNVLDLKIWNKLLMAGALGYKHSPYLQKQSFLRCTKQYIKKFKPSVQLTPFSCKFKLHEYNFNDIIDFTYFMKQTQDPNLFKLKPISISKSKPKSNSNQNQDQNPKSNQNVNVNQNQNVKSPSIKQYSRAYNLFHHRFFLYYKTHFVLNQNIYVIREELNRYAQGILKFVDFWDLEQLLFVYAVFGRYGGGGVDLMDRLLNRIFYRIQHQHIQDKLKLNRMYKSILKTWTNSSKYQKQIWQTKMQPFLLQSFEQSKAQNKNGWIQIDWRNIAYSMICCGLTQSPLLTKIVQQLQKKKDKHNTTQIITQYLLVKQLQKEGKNLSHNLPKNIKSQRKEYKKGHKQQIEYNPTQQFWYNVVKRVIGQENTRMSVFITSYQIDILGMYQGQFYAFEIQGMHYRDQDDNLTGKKKVKREILAAYGIKVIEINAEQNQPKVIRRFKRVHAGELYIRSLLNQCIQESAEGKKQVQTKSG